MLSMSYGDKRLFALLSLLFSFVDLKNQFHIDHIFPISRFTTARLRRAGVPDDKIERLARMANELPNLQLLEGPANVEKQAALPSDWLADRYKLASDRAHYCSIHLLGDVPVDIAGFEAFYAARRALLRQRITDVLIGQRGAG